MDVSEVTLRSFFARPERPRDLRIGERHLAILENLARLRLASSAQLAALDGGSVQNVSRELRALFEHGLVERPIGQAAARFLQEGSRPAIYGLTRKGARLLRKFGGGVRRRLLDGIDKERGAGWRFIEHTVAISQFLVDLEVTARGRENVRLLRHSEILEDSAGSRRDRRVRLSAKVRIGEQVRHSGVVPDALFGLRFDDETESYFMLEIDRGEMAIERYKRAHERTNFAKKMAIYFEANRERQHTRELGIENFRVLTVTTTEGRVAKMIEALEAVTNGKGSNIFLFTDQTTLSRNNPLAGC